MLNTESLNVIFVKSFKILLIFNACSYIQIRNLSIKINMRLTRVHFDIKTPCNIVRNLFNINYQNNSTYKLFENFPSS